MSDRERVEATAAQFLIELAFLVPRGTDLSTIGKKLTDYVDARLAALEHERDEEAEALLQGQFQREREALRWRQRAEHAEAALLSLQTAVYEAMPSILNLFGDDHGSPQAFEDCTDSECAAIKRLAALLPDPAGTE